MTRDEHLLACLAEECDEVGQRVMKALRFGLDEVQLDQEMNNADRIVDEVQDLIAVAFILQAENVLPSFMPMPGRVEAKRAKIERYMEISRDQGVLDVEAGNG